MLRRHALRSGVIVAGFFAIVTLIVSNIGAEFGDHFAIKQFASCMLVVGLTLVTIGFLLQRRDSHRRRTYVKDIKEEQALALELRSGKAIICVFCDTVYWPKAFDIELDFRHWTTLSNGSVQWTAVDPGVHTVSSVDHACGSRGDYMLAMYEGGVYCFEQYFTFGFVNPRHGIRLVPVEAVEGRVPTILRQPVSYSRFSEDQIIGLLQQVAAGLSVNELCRQHGISESSYYLWRSKYGGVYEARPRPAPICHTKVA